MLTMDLQSCDTFVVLPPSTSPSGCVIFGKNSDRPKGEVQEVVYVPAESHPAGSKVQCTYIEVDQVSSTRATILSKPAWMWGAEMGANESGVCIGNEAVFTRLNSDTEDLQEKLLGMDLVRLGLERSGSAREAVDVITTLLEKYGQGGPCSDTKPKFTYYNSFLIADSSEAWILETTGHLWAAEHVTSGYRNISNCLSIGTKIDLMSRDLKSHAQSSGYWNPAQGDLNFAEAYGKVNESATKRFAGGKALLSQLSESGKFSASCMFQVLRDCDSGICRGEDHEHPTAGAQVSVLPSQGSQRLPCHWFSATPDPAHSVFKPFIFGSSNCSSKHTVSPTFADAEDPAKMQPRFQFRVDRSHALYKKHQEAYPVLVSGTPKGEEVMSALKRLETQCLEKIEENLANNSTSNMSKVAHDLFEHIVESEMKHYCIE